MEKVILAKFVFGPFDQEVLVLPTPEPWPKFVIPHFGAITIEHFYLLAGQIDNNMWAYLYEADKLTA